MATYVNDGTIDFSGGQNDGTLGDRIEQNQFCKGINVTTEGGVLGPRPGFVEKPIAVVTEGNVNGRSYESILRNGKFQSAISYDADNGSFILAVFSGVLFRIDPRRGEAEVITIGETKDKDRMNQYRRRIPSSHAGRFAVFYDYPDVPVVIDNQEARRATKDHEIPVSVLGAYVQNRLWICNARHEFTAGDPVGGINGDAPITFEEVFAPASAFFNQIFSLGSQSANKPITAMGFLQVADQSTGVGPLIISTKNSIYTGRTDLVRSEWEQSIFTTLALYTAGIAGSRAFVNQHSDLIFLSGDNQVYSLFIGRKDQERWANTAISNEVKQWLESFANDDLIELATLANYRNRVFIPVAPYQTNATSLDGHLIPDYAHGGMVVLEAGNVAGLGRDANPAWAGLWTGISPMEIVVLNEGPYVFSKDDGGINRLYFIDETISWDVFNGEEREIVSRVYTREYDFQSRLQDKKLGTIDYSFSNVSGDFFFRADYRPGHSPRWNKWGEFRHLAVTQLEDSREAEGLCQDDEELPTLATHAFREMNLGDPEEISADPLTDDTNDTCRKIGLRLTLQGRSWKLEDLRLKFEVMPETMQQSHPNCGVREELLIEECDSENDWNLHRTATKDAEWPIPISIR